MVCTIIYLSSLTISLRLQIFPSCFSTLLPLVNAYPCDVHFRLASLIKSYTLSSVPTNRRVASVEPDRELTGKWWMASAFAVARSVLPFFHSLLLSGVENTAGTGTKWPGRGESNLLYIRSEEQNRSRSNSIRD